ncbi:uncharacterized protein LOC124915005 [Impatiens glandulifera]|uniref:uncharacterized protein LOC124915005 n=1 Tax=Impatiens glandulifera TaxID=253017 RepID=UPI001FB0D8AF|nr:uncharacterized protein LOC124915005 [Impatiens glandulifera]
MQCSQETIARLFYNVSSSFFLFLLFFYFTSILLSKFFQFFGTPIFHRNQDGYEFNTLSEEEEEDMEEEEEEEDNSYFHGGEVKMMISETIYASSSTVDNPIWQSNPMDIIHDHDHDHEPYEAFLSPASSESKQTADDDDDEEESEAENNEIPSCDSHADVNHAIPWPTQNHHHDHHHHHHHKTQPENRPTINHHHDEEEEQREKQSSNGGVGSHDHEPPTNTESSRKLRWKEEEEENGVVFGDACTVGSISRDSSEWRDSSYTEDPFSSSSRRSCFKWESYPIFQKYEDEMLLFDKIIWEKLQESETLKYIQSRPKSMSKRIVHIFIPGTKHSSSTTNYHRRHYHELESAYVAQICLTWEALSWNYNYFCRLKASRRDADPGCPAYVAQQFQQFQVLLQRYNETEPYERGKRPEIYTRKRISSPKLLQVPEYRDSNDEERENPGPGSRIPSNSFLSLMEESIKTFMDFLKADKQSRISKVVLFEKTRIRTDQYHHNPITDPTRILLLKKVNKKKKRKVKEIRRGGHRWTFKKKSGECKGEEEMEILMSLIDLKVVERVLRMGYEFEYLDEEKLQWCEEKMNKVRIMHNGKVKRDSSTSPPLLFPASVHHNQH